MFSLLRISVILLFLFPFSASFGTVSYDGTLGAAERGTGLSCILPGGFWASFSNQALLAYNKSSSAGVSYENRFGIPELSNRSVAAIFKTGNSSEGLEFSYFGYPGFRRMAAGLSCGLLLTENIAAGVQIDYFSEIVRGESYRKQVLTFETGAIFKLSDKVTAGFHLFNPVPNLIRKSDLPSAITGGAGIELTKSLFAGAEAEMRSGQNLVIRTGFDYEAIKNFRIRGGFSTENSSFSFGLGYEHKSVTLDIGFSTHECLGVSSSISLIFKIR